MSVGKFLRLGSVLCILGLSGMAEATTIAQYNFDSVTHPADGQTVVADASGNGHDVTWRKTLSQSKDGPFGQTGDSGINVDSKTIGIPDKADGINLSTNGNQFTIEGWIKPTAADSTNYIVQLGGKVGTVNIYIYLGMTDAKDHAGQGYGDISVGGTHHAIYTKDALVLNKWNYLALTYDGQKATLYVLNDNNPALQTVDSVAINRPMPASITLSHIIASNNSGTSSVAYDDIRISDTALTDAELGYHKAFAAEQKPTTQPAGGK